MAEAPTMIKTTKKLSAMRQILAAIRMMESVDYECAITLAGAAEGQIDEKLILEGTVPHIFRILRSVWAKEPVNEDINWMKHPSGAEEREITQFQAVLAIARAIHKYVGAYQETHQRFEDFSAWAVAKGHIPRKLAEPAEKLA
jgi:hypothetical protein